MNRPIDEELSREERDFLTKFEFDRARFERLRADYLDGKLDPARFGVVGTVSVPTHDAFVQIPPIDAREYEELRAIGEAALFAGEVGVIVLNGGMATRFGGQVKGAVEVLEGHSFLALKLASVANRPWGQQVPVYLMNSFATDVATREHLAAQPSLPLMAANLQCFVQDIAPRLWPNGMLYRDVRGHLSYYGTGHGDLAEAFRRSHLSPFLDRGGRYLLMSNVDNLLADVDPVLLGMHIRGGCQITVEIADKYAGDVGGTPALVDGQLQIVETFRFPDYLDHTAIPYHNTNTLWFSVEALADDYSLHFYAVEKEVDGTIVVQFERLVGELTAHVPTQCVLVPREGVESRFLPVKKPHELDAARSFFSRVLRLRNAL
ncbi:MAG: UTP--glucose-1-phosphate uridylyltransferase [Myxococcales bacterium]|nr:UTP--glucose-1-phosphate uridylyltransferase [Myxococcales bacterium]